MQIVSLFPLRFRINDIISTEFFYLKKKKKREEFIKNTSKHLVSNAVKIHSLLKE